MLACVSSTISSVAVTLLPKIDVSPVYFPDGPD